MNRNDFYKQQPSAVDAVKKGGDYWFCHTGKYRAEVTPHDVDVWKMNGAVWSGKKQIGFAGLICDAVTGSYKLD